ncbi:hypothetical protein [Pleomorphovibrio marinus]|uniref:hypothetical protein n=1 Tax=Pleomorphovibrio marinus TaxID=2164132 RepID=UPI000E0C2704|nr:hypothetical protein [Pleomorphovibrio marinus]
MQPVQTITYAKKLLPSGNLQVKFFVKRGIKEKYGYLLLCENMPEQEILMEIRQRLEFHESTRADFYRFNFTRGLKDDHTFFLYSA